MCLGVTGLKGAFSRGVVSEARHVLGPLWLTVLMLPMQVSVTVTCVYITLAVCVCVFFFWCTFKGFPQNVWFGLSTVRSRAPTDAIECNKEQLFPKQHIQINDHCSNH